jgi:hypothetical protein
MGVERLAHAPASGASKDVSVAQPLVRQCLKRRITEI